MKKPRYMQELLKIIFFWLSVTFLIMGPLAFLGILKPSENSMVQDTTLMGIIFSSIGIAFFITAIVLAVISSSKHKLHQELLAQGTRINGTVERVYLQTTTHYGNKSPYRILYSYSWQGNVYYRKSDLLWEKPDLVEGDSVVVYCNDFGKSMIL